MNIISHLKNKIKNKLNAIPKAFCEDCCLRRDHECDIEFYHIIYYFDRCFSKRSNVQKFRLRVLEALLFECIPDIGMINYSLTEYQAFRPWLWENKENMLPCEFNSDGWALDGSHIYNSFFNYTFSKSKLCVDSSCYSVKKIRSSGSAEGDRGAVCVCVCAGSVRSRTTARWAWPNGDWIRYMQCTVSEASVWKYTIQK